MQAGASPRCVLSPRTEDIGRRVASGIVHKGSIANEPPPHRRNLLVYCKRTEIRPAKVGPIQLPTAFAAPMLKGLLVSGGIYNYVWLYASGHEMGQSVYPLFRSGLTLPCRMSGSMNIWRWSIQSGWETSKRRASPPSRRLPQVGDRKQMTKPLSLTWRPSSLESKQWLGLRTREPTKRGGGCSFRQSMYRSTHSAYRQIL